MTMTRTALAIAGLSACFALSSNSVLAADHADFPQFLDDTDILARDDARITDLWAFIDKNGQNKSELGAEKSGENGRQNLVLILGINPFLDGAVTDYIFPTDVTYSFFIDNNSGVTIDSSVITQEFGGVINSPSSIQEDIRIDVTFNANNQPQLSVSGAHFTTPGDATSFAAQTKIFTGLRAEATILAPFVRNNIAGIVLEVPLKKTKANQDELIIWSTTSLQGPSGTYGELAGRAEYSVFDTRPNNLHPSQHVAAGLPVADVMVFDTGSPVDFPSGRLLTEQQYIEVGTFTTLPDDGLALVIEADLCTDPLSGFFPCPVAFPAQPADVAVLTQFPWLAKPYAPTP